MNSTTELDRGADEPHRRPLRITSDASYYDPELRCTVLATTPAQRPTLWRAFVDGALRSYSHFGVEKALEYDRIIDGSTTSMFLVALDDAGEPVGGLRAQGPYSKPHQTHADIEWSKSWIGRAALRRMVSARLANGVVEMKTVWSAVDRTRHGAPGYFGAIGASLVAAASGCRHTLATSAEHAVGPYLDSGAVMATHIDAVAYPDDRYRTRILWWDQNTVPLFATAEKLAQITFAVESLRGRELASTEAEAS